MTSHTDCYASCPLIFLPYVWFASIYASTAAKSYILNYMWTAANFIIEGRMRLHGRRLCTVGLKRTRAPTAVVFIHILSAWWRSAFKSKWSPKRIIEAWFSCTGEQKLRDVTEADFPWQLLRPQMTIKWKLGFEGGCSTGFVRR